MPDALLPSEGLGDQLQYILRAPIPGVLSWKLILWVNDVTPTAATKLADLTEASFGGYVATQLQRSMWTVPAVTGKCAVSTWGTEPLVWYVSDGPIETIYGYALVDITEGVLRLVQRFDSADIEPVQVGGRFTLLPRYTLTSAPC